jgi:hypothetical protein
MMMHRLMRRALPWAFLIAAIAGAATTIKSLIV